MSKKKPETPREWATYRAKLSCRIGRDVIEGQTTAPGGISRTEYAIYNLLHAVEEIADALSQPCERKSDKP
jgi:hypothetical protein